MEVRGPAPAGATSEDSRLREEHPHGSTEQELERGLVAEQPCAQPATSYRVVSNATLRDHCDRRGSNKLGSLAPGTVVRVLEKSVNSQGQARLRTAEGWVSLVARDGTVLLEDMKTDSGVRRGEREELAADMTAWLLDHPDGDLSGWVEESAWVRSLGSHPYAPCIASRCWPDVFEEQKRQMELLPGSSHDQPTERLDFDALRALGRQWAMEPMISDDESAVHEPLTAPAVLPGSTEGTSSHLVPATWSDARDAAASAAKIMEACGEATSKSAAVSTVSSPQSGAATSPVTPGALGPAWEGTQPAAIDGDGKDDDRDEGDDDDGSEDWTYIDTSAWCPPAGARDAEQRVDTEWELVNTE